MTVGSADAHTKCSMSTPRHSAWPWLILLMMVGCAFNLTKPYHVDDTAHLEIAHAILADPLHPMSGKVNWRDTAKPIHHLNQPHLFFYLLAGAIAVGGTSEPVLHLLIACFTCGVILLFHAVARRFFAGQALLLTAMLVLGPAFLPGQNLMVDVPLLFIWLAAIGALLGAVGAVEASVADASRGMRRYALSGAMIAAACLTKYSSLVLVPLYVLTALMRRHIRALWTLLLPVGALMAWSCFNLLDYGAIHILNRPQLDVTVERVILRGVEWIAAVGAAAPFSVAFMPRPGMKWNSWISILAGVAVGVAAGLAISTHSKATIQIAVLWGVFIGNGVFVLCLVGQGAVHSLREAGQSDDRAARDRTLVVLLWLAGTSLFMVLFAPFMSMRSVLLAVPALLLLLPWKAVATARPLVIGALVLTTLLGTALAVSDYRCAAVYRDYASRIKSEAPEGARIWFLGHWGWQWYAQAAGMKQYDPKRTALGNGDFVVYPERIHTTSVSAQDRARLVKVGEYTVSGSPWVWLRTLAVDPPGGYYAFFLNMKNCAPPWRFSRAPVEVFSILKVVEGTDAGSQ